MKKCKKCGEDKEVTDFYKGHAICKECYKAKVRAHRAENIEHYRKYDRGRGNRQAPGYVKQYRTTYPNKYRATNMVNNAIRDGRMKRQEQCSVCESTDYIHAHHDDYAYPLSVRWMCAACHKQWHVKHGDGKNP